MSSLASSFPLCSCPECKYQDEQEAAAYTLAYNAGFDAYCNGTDLNPVEQSVAWQAGYNSAYADHMRMEAYLEIADLIQ